MAQYLDKECPECGAKRLLARRNGLNECRACGLNSGPTDTRNPKRKPPALTPEQEITKLRAENAELAKTVAEAALLIDKEGKSKKGK